MLSRKHAVRAAISLGASLLLANGAHAQETIPAHSLQGLLTDIPKRLNLLQLGSPTGPGTESIGTVALLTALEVSTAPLGTSSGSFSFTFDRQLGTFKRSTESFGPMFGRRSLTSGKGKGSAGFNSLHAVYDSIAGLSLSNGDFRTAINVVGLPPISYVSARVDAASDTYVGFVSYGLTDNFDVGVAVPWVRLSVAVDIGLFDANNVDFTPGGHLLLLPKTIRSGVGDIAVIGKYRVWRRGEGGVAAEVEVRLPSGDTANLRGSGVTRTLASAIWSRGGSLSPHANIGYEFWSDGVALSSSVSAKNQVNYAFGLELRAHSRATATVDIVGRRQLHGGQLGYRNVILGRDGSVDVLASLPKGLNVVSFAPGIKWNVAGNVLLTGNVLASLANKGLRANVIPVVGFEWAF